MQVYATAHTSVRYNENRDEYIVLEWNPNSIQRYDSVVFQTREAAIDGANAWERWIAYTKRNA